MDHSTGSLKGGAPNNKRKLNSCLTSKELELINRGTDCFVNSVIQLMRNTEYVKFIKSCLSLLITNSPPNSYKLAKRLSYIYDENSVGIHKSTSFIRTHVAQMSGKEYLDRNTQQDAEEFFRALEGVLHEELIEFDEFKVAREAHWGKVKTIRKFIDNSTHGTCPVCGMFPLERESPFLFLSLNNVPRTTGITLSGLVKAHFTESTMNMKCHNCCENLNHGGACPQVGLCKSKKTVEIHKLTKYPSYLFVQVNRNVGNSPKITTFVKIEREIVIPEHQTYEIIGIIDHVGSS